MVEPDIDSIHRYIAYVSVGASTVRGLRTKGVVAAARNGLRSVDLSPYATKSASDFLDVLDADTNSVRLALPRGVRFWGVARKVLNIFLRGALYNTYLNRHYKLSMADAFFEIPLDSLSAAGIRDRVDANSRPKWVGVKYVTPEINATFQNLASEIATKENTLRVHLDAEFWGGR